MVSEINPYAAPQTAPARPPEPAEEFRRRRLRFAIGFAALVLIGSPLASAFALFDIESIVVSGPVLSLFAVVLAVLSIRVDLRAFWIISLLMIGMSIGCFLTIYLMQWSPGQAQIPIGRATVVFAVSIQVGWMFVRSIWVRGMHPGAGVEG